MNNAIPETLRTFIREEKPGLEKIVDMEEVLKLDSKRILDMHEKLLGKGCTLEIAIRFTVLVLYDLVVLVGLDPPTVALAALQLILVIDDSSSMERVYEGGETPDHAMTTILDEVAKIYEMAKSDGIMSIRFLNTRQGLQNVTSERVKELAFKTKHNGVTNMASRLEKKILEPYLYKERQPPFKPLLIMIITDGVVSAP
jgi:hypothetical protein